MPSLKAIIVHVLIGLTDITFCTYVDNYVNMCFTLKRTICEISLCTKYVIFFKKRHYIIIIIIIIIIKDRTIIFYSE